MDNMQDYTQLNGQIKFIQQKSFAIELIDGKEVRINKPPREFEDIFEDLDFYALFEHNGKIIEKGFFENNNEFLGKYVYNYYDNLLRRKNWFYKGKELIHSTYYNYDNNGFIKERCKYFVDNLKILELSELKCNSIGNCIGEINYWPDGLIESKIRRIFNEEHQLVYEENLFSLEKKYIPNDEIFVELFIGEKGFLIEKSNDNHDFSIFDGKIQTYYFYDSAGIKNMEKTFVIDYSNINRNREISGKVIIYKEYGGKILFNNTIELFKKFDQNDSYDEELYLFATNQELLKKFDDHSLEGYNRTKEIFNFYDSYFELCYDQENNIAKMINIVFEYDNYNNWIEKKFYENGIIKEVVERFIEYF